MKTIIAFLFKRKGEDNLSFSDLYLALSMGLNWFAPSDAKKIINNAIEHRLLVEEKKTGLLHPSFDYEKYAPPAEFRPPENLLENIDEQVAPSLLETVLQAISESTNQPQDDLQKRVLKLSKEKQVTPETAALLLGKKENVEIARSIEEVEKKLLTGNEE